MENKSKARYTTANEIEDLYQNKVSFNLKLIQFLKVL